VINGSPADMRARAGTQYTLKLNGVINTIDQAKGTIMVTNVQFADTNRSGVPQNLGAWTVTAPASFDFASVSTGMTITIGVDANTFNVANHIVTATTLTTKN